MKTICSPALLAFLGCSVAAFAEVKLPALISDNMVLLQDKKANVWGTADPGEKVTVTLASLMAGRRRGQGMAGPEVELAAEVSALPPAEVEAAARAVE